MATTTTTTTTMMLPKPPLPRPTTRGRGYMCGPRDGRDIASNTITRGFTKPDGMALDMVYRAGNRRKSSGSPAGAFPRPPGAWGGLPPKKKLKNLFDCIGDAVTVAVAWSAPRRDHGHGHGGTCGRDRDRSRAA